MVTERIQCDSKRYYFSEVFYNRDGNVGKEIFLKVRKDPQSRLRRDQPFQSYQCQQEVPPWGLALQQHAVVRTPTLCLVGKETRSTEANTP